MTTRPRRLLVLGWLCGMLLAGCGTTTPTPTPTASPTALDFTVPDAAVVMVNRLLAETGSDKVLTVDITKDAVEVTVLDEEEQPVAWAYRNGEIGEVATDQQYVDQATFDVSRFNFSDVGALFRAAAGQSGSAQNQTLTIVDYSGGNVTMSVSTVPESRTVFFTPSGGLLPVLNFDTEGGIAQGIADTVGARLSVYSITVDAGQGVWVDYPGAPDTIVRRTRTSKVPVTTNVTARSVDLPLFPAARVSPAAIWKVVDAARSAGDLPDEGGWSVVIDDRRNLGTPRMYFSFGTRVVTTDLEGNEVIA
ncbi:MAG: hypothetical protein KDB60_08850 [Propionibacteriaceae bacterium]|nr:hypothetical protein [Propionibacteriaceae bacterium]